MAESVGDRIRWTSSNMLLLNAIRSEFEESRPFDGLRIGVSLHLEAKTAVLLETLQRGGADVVAAGNLGSTQDEVVAYLNQRGIDARGSRSDDADRHQGIVESVITTGPDLLLDNGADLAALALRDGLEVLGGTEETTSGHMRLVGELGGRINFPVIVINDSPLKAIAENKHAVGQSVYESFCRLTNLMPQGKRVLVVGYGWCGRGIAQYMRANGATVMVTEVDEIKALEAALDGFFVGALGDLVKDADIAITATGAKGVVDIDDLAGAPSHIILANAGHFPTEIDLASIEAASVERLDMGEEIGRYVLADGRHIDVVAQGRMLNLAGPHPKGNSIESMDLGFAMQARCLERVAGNHTALEAGPHPVPDDINRELARQFVEVMHTR